MKTTANCPPKKRTGNQTMQQRSLFKATHEPVVSKIYDLTIYWLRSRLTIFMQRKVLVVGLAGRFFNA